MTIRYALLGARPSGVAAALLGTADVDGDLALVVGRAPTSLPDGAQDVTALQLPPELDGDEVAVDGWLLEALLSHAVDLLVTLGPGQDVGDTTASTMHNRILTLEALPNGVGSAPSVLVAVRLWTADPDRPNPVVVQRTVPASELDDGEDTDQARAELLVHALTQLAHGALDLDGIAEA